jgi:hypothetical protein
MGETNMHRIKLKGDERGMTTAELLGNAALGVLALVVIWAALQALGVDIVNMLHDALVK